MKKIFAIFFMVLFTCQNFLMAGDETRNSRAYANQITIPGTFIQTQDDKFPATPSTWITGFVNYSNKAIVELGLNEELHLPHAAFKVCASFDVQLTDASFNTVILTNQQLDINYNPSELTRYKDKAQLVYVGYYKARVFNVKINSCNLAANCGTATCNGVAPSDVYIQAEITTNRIYNFSFATTFPATAFGYTTIPANNEVDIFWDYVLGAEEYELEYTYIDDYDVSLTPRSQSVLNYDLDHDATRIITSERKFRIALNYERGYLIYRVRPIGRSTTNERMDGSWAGANPNGLVSGVPANAKIALAPFSADKITWESTQTFAEQGRTGSGVSFMDPLGYKRQTIARNNTDFLNIAQSTLYDHYGRPTINFLPAPVNGLTFNYRFSLNKYIPTGSVTPVEFDKKIYDVISPAQVAPLCSATGFTLDPVSSLGATKYYSPLNPNKQGAQAFLPDAENLAYTHIKYKPDGLGRISFQSMPGNTHQLGSGKELKYFYAKPSQVELDRLFGAEAGDAINYYKNFVLDPNGQLSTTYLDMYGRTMATALVGNKPSQLDDLPNKPAPIIFLDNLSNSPTNWTDTLNKCKEVNTTIFISKVNSAESYTYNTTVGTISSPCDSATICFECKYDLEISIKDECGEEIFNFNSNLPNSYTTSIGATTPYNSVTCTYTPGNGYPVGNYFNLSATPISIVFPKVGSYSIYKKICVNNDPLDDYTDIFIESQTCVDKCGLFNALMDSLNFNGCLPQTCQTCTAQVHAYIENLFAQPNLPRDTLPITPQQISQLYQNCASLCAPKTSCEKYRRLLEMDFYPNSGQYATTNPTVVPSFNYSIFNPLNSLTGSPTWFNPTTLPYKNAIGQNDFISIANVSVVPQALNQTQFITFFKNSWAANFVTSHPEYCKLYFYCDLLSSAMNYDDQIKNIMHYDSACATGFVKPITFNSAPLGPANTCFTVNTNVDPIVALAGFYPGFAPAITNFTNTISGNMFNSGQNIYGFSSNGTYANNVPPGHYFGKDTCTADAEWWKFKSNYLTQKYYLYQNLMTLFLASPGSYSYTGGPCGTAPTGFTSHFPNWGDSLSAFTNTPMAQITNTTQISVIGNQMANNASTLTAANCTNNCQSYVALWNQNLNQGCPAYSSANNTIKNNILNSLQNICLLGCNGSNPMGASSIAPFAAPYTIPSTNITVTNFQQVLNYYLTGSITTSVCSAVVMANPKPYPVNLANQPNQALSDCGCDKILKANYDFYNSPLPGINSAWKMFRKQNGFDLNEYNALLCVCQSAVGNATWTPNYVWSGPQLTSLTSFSNVTVSPKLNNCSSCIKCTDVVAAINNFTTTNQLLSPTPYQSYGSILNAITQDSVDYIFAINSLNNQFGGNHSIYFYTNLYQDCQDFDDTNPAVALTFSNNITPKAFELYTYLNSLVKTKFMHKNHVTSLCTDSKLYLSSLYTGTFSPGLPYGLNVTPYSYQVNPPNAAGNTLTLSIVSGTTTIYQVKLTYPISYTGNWSKFKSLNTYKAFCPSPLAGSNYTFVVNAVDKNLAVVTLTGQVLNSSIPICNLSPGGNPKPQYCKPAPTPTVNSCIAGLVNNALTQSQLALDDSLAALASIFEHRYKNRCLAGLKENFLRSYEFNSEHNYTLYYYDEAGNLYRTVAPKGVDEGTANTGILPITQALPLNSTTFPLYSSATIVDTRYVNEYKFNSYNQPLSENTIDGGFTTFFYDRVGRVVLSQNAKQTLLGNTYSYTKYDDIGRIIEVGQVKRPSAFTQVQWEDVTVLFPLIAANTSTRTDVTTTFYDTQTANATVLNKFTASTQRYLRNRVSSAQHEEFDDNNPLTFDKGTFYSYDDQGNVAELVQYNKDLTIFNKSVSKVNYEYELISSNVTKAIYEKGQADQYMHKYFYDSDNRLHEVYTSKDELNWDRDAKYFYYEHGTLARIERADKQVQGTDYFYTIHGWIKGLNSDAMLINADAGKDAAATNAYLTSYNKVHGYFAEDAMSFSLNYYNSGTNKDYTSINNANYSNANLNPIANINALTTTQFDLNSSPNADGPSLFNGNISSMVTSFINKDLTTNQTLHPKNKAFSQITAYRYDQLHRITQMKAYSSITANAWDTPTNSTYDGSYFMNFSYDPNGNILSLRRDGVGPNIKSGLPLVMDNLNYKYKTIANGYVKNYNQLTNITDAVGLNNPYTDDIDASPTFGADRYDYDNIGNLIKDEGEYIQTIEWTVDRKVRRVIRNVTAMLATGTSPTSIYKPDIEYEYNAMRQRVTKIIKPRNQVTKQIEPINTWMYTYYIYDASGNVLAVYDRKTSLINNNSTYQDKLSLGEHHIYGSKRLAIMRPVSSVDWSYTYPNCGGNPSTCRTILGPVIVPPPPSVTSYTTARYIGYKEFELDNHLGNVIAVVSDRKIQINTCAVFYRTFNDGNLSGVLADGANLTIDNNMLKVVPTSAYAGVNFSYPTDEGLEYNISFDVDMGTSDASDGLTATAYGYNQTTDTYGPAFISIPINGNGSYNLNYVGQPQTTGFTKLYFVFGTNTGTTSPHYFYIDNFKVALPPQNIIAPPPCLAANLVFDHYFPDLLQHTDYYAFGMAQNGRSWNGTADNYRFNYQSQEKDPELWGGAITFKYRTEDPRLGRFFSVDPLALEYPWNSPYAFSENRVIDGVEIEGLEVGILFGTASNVTKFGIEFGTDASMAGISGSFAETVRFFPPIPAPPITLPLPPGSTDKPLEMTNKNITKGKDATDVKQPNIDKSALEKFKPAVEKTNSDKVEKGKSGDGKGKNKLEPNKKADGDHTTFSRNKKGDVYKYETYEKTKTGHFNPKKRFDGGKPDGTKGAPHKNKNTGEDVETPHVQGKDIPGGVRKATPQETPASTTKGG